jgi:hypothetical protein
VRVGLSGSGREEDGIDNLVVETDELSTESACSEGVEENILVGVDGNYGGARPYISVHVEEGVE